MDIILNEEKRSYKANGRSRGGLGSLNVGLQSEPDGGWTEEGRYPNFSGTNLKPKLLRHLMQLG